MSKSNMELKVSFLAGTRIEDALIEAREKAQKFDVAYILFNFNGTKFSVSGNAEIKEMLEEWRNKEDKYGIVG